MYCPRCGTQAVETTKFCRSCGLSLTPVTTYVATGGTAPLTPPPMHADITHTSSARSFWDKLPPYQQMIASILAFIFAVPFLGVFAGGRLAGMAAILMPLGIIWSVLYFRAKQRELEQRHHQAAQMYTPPTTAFQSPPPVAVPTPQPRTNPLADNTPVPPYVPPSVTEQETQRLPQPPRQAQ
ncbi:MAG TPA: zinc-ribbon domain-containing protein [Blastocatellia bacterium]|nr:zinc-ribbon domain-containing protein [Blastocatellia bacterium]